MGDKKQKMADTKIVPRRPKYLFRGSEHQHPLGETGQAFERLRTGDSKLT
jgi:hypothetical protein